MLSSRHSAGEWQEERIRYNHSSLAIRNYTKVWLGKVSGYICALLRCEALEASGSGSRLARANPDFKGGLLVH